MLYVFYGDDDFSAQEALRGLYQSVGPSDVWSSNIADIEAASFDLAHLVAMAQTVPFLAERRLVIVRGLLATAEPQRQAQRRGRRAPAGRADASPVPSLATAMEELPPTTDVAFIDGKLTPANPLIKELSAMAQVQEFSPLRRDELARWVHDRMTQKGGSITGSAVAEIVELVGSNLGAMDTELEKLATYCQDRSADREDVRTLVASAREVNVFALVDAIMERRLPVALQLMDQLMKAGGTGPYLLTMIARQARLVALAQALAQEKVATDEWGARLGITQGFVLRKTSEQSRRFSPDQVRHLYRLLVQADMAMKMGEVSDDLALVELLARATVVGSRAGK